MGVYRSRRAAEKASKLYNVYESEKHKEGHAVRVSCKKCKPFKDTTNEHRFHGMGAFKETHIGYCRRHCCAAQDEPKCYRRGQLKRKGKRRKSRYSAACCLKRRR